MLFLYTNGPSALTVNPAAGDNLAYAMDYADTAITPNGLLATRRFDANGHEALAGPAKPSGRPIAPRPRRPAPFTVRRPSWPSWPLSSTPRRRQGQPGPR